MLSFCLTLNPLTTPLQTHRFSPSCLSFLSNMPRVPSGRFDSPAKPGQPSNCASTVKFRKHPQGNLAIPYTEFLVILVEETVARTL
ncbi:hypothetical protein SLA2020_080420 [Shorea laevis]